MIWQIARREIVTRGQTKAFQVLTAVLLVGVIVAAVSISLVTGSSDEASEFTIGLSGDGTEFADQLSVETDEVAPTVVETSDGETLLETGDIDVLFTGDELVWEGFPIADLDLYIRTSVQQAEFAERVDDLGLGNAELAALFGEVQIEERLLDGEDDEQFVRFGAATVSTIAMFMLLTVWGGFLMMGVVEEKSSRVVEVLLSHVEARTLLTGKILGLGVLALMQLLIIVAGMAAGLLAVRDIEVPSGVWSSVPILLVTFLLGYAFYASAFAALGSTVSRQEDAQAAQLPAMIPLAIGYGIGISSVQSPDTLLVKIASYVPFTSPVVLPFRVALTNPPAWQVALSLFLLAASVPLMLNLAGRIYRSTLLNVGARVPLLHAFRNRNATL